MFKETNSKTLLRKDEELEYRIGTLRSGEACGIGTYASSDRERSRRYHCVWLLDPRSVKAILRPSEIVFQRRLPSRLILFSACECFANSGPTFSRRQLCVNVTLVKEIESTTSHFGTVINDSMGQQLQLRNLRNRQHCGSQA